LDFSNDYALTEKIIGCAMRVHRQLGPGFLESVYRNAVAFELRRVGLTVELEKHLTVKYEHVVVGDFVADVVVNDIVICELKAASGLSKADEVQLVNYLTATSHDTGLLLNFGAPSLQFKRKYRRQPVTSEDVDLHSHVNPFNPVNPV
jgi:GxxExxY protein